MGGWNFMRSRLESLIEKPLEYVGRKASASTATGFPNVYKEQQAEIIETAINA